MSLEKKKKPLLSSLEPQRLFYLYQIFLFAYLLQQKRRLQKQSSFLLNIKVRI